MIFKYCPKCKAKLPKMRDRLLGCKKCGFSFYFSPSVGVDAVLLNNKKEVLLTKRVFDPGKGRWDIPGGFIEFAETAEQALRREIKEELGIRSGQLHYLGTYPDRYLYNGINYYTLSISFYSFIKEKKFNPQDDISDAKFFPLNKLPRPLFTPRVAKTLRDYKKLMRKKL